MVSCYTALAGRQPTLFAKLIEASGRILKPSVTLGLTVSPGATRLSLSLIFTPDRFSKLNRPEMARLKHLHWLSQRNDQDDHSSVCTTKMLEIFLNDLTILAASDYSLVKDQFRRSLWARQAGG